jgi:hypothetical protein
LGRDALVLEIVRFWSEKGEGIGDAVLAHELPITSRLPVVRGRAPMLMSRRNAGEWLRSGMPATAVVAVTSAVSGNLLIRSLGR